MTKSDIRVIFRKSVNEGIEYIDCIFIDSLPENGRDLLTCYARIGQHSTCSIDWVYETRPASEIEYKSLLNEVASIYDEYNLVVMKKLPGKASLRLKEAV